MEELANPQITASCVITPNKVYKNDLLLFESPENSFAGFSAACYHHFALSYPKFHKMDHLAKLGWLAAEVLLQGSFNRAAYNAERVSVILANANSSLDTDLRYMQSIAAIPSPALFVYTLPNIVIGEICIRHQFKGENAFYIQDNFDAEFLSKTVKYLFERDVTDVCICGWTDILGEDYKAALFLVERSPADGAIPFTATRLYTIFDK
jgi:hypothetical protein